MKKVAVIGAGITGLSAAHALKKRGYDPLLFEARAAPGGAIRTLSTDGYLVEEGPNSMQENTPEATALLADLGIEDNLLEAKREASRRYIVRDGKPVALPSSPPGIFTTRALSFRGKLRLLREPFISAPPAGAPDECVAEFTRRRLGKESLDYLVNPFVSGIFAGDPEKLSLRHAFPRLYDLEREHGSLIKGMKADAKKGKRKPPRLISFEGGLQTLVERLNQSLEKRTYLETTAESLEPADGAWKLVAGRYGRQLREHFDAVVLALPAKSLARLKVISEYAGAIQPVEEIEYSPVVSLSLGFNRDQVDHPLDGFGLLVPAVERRDVLGILFPSTVFPGRAPSGRVLLTLFLGGARRPDLIAENDESLFRMAGADAASLLGIKGEPVFRHITRWPEAIPQMNLGHDRFLTAIGSFEQQHPGCFVAGNFRDGVSLGNCIAGGLRHGSRAADYLDQIEERPRRADSEPGGTGLSNE